MLFNWVAFGPGEREFSVSISIPIIAIDFDRANQIVGRIVFGILALIMDVGLVYVMYRLIVDAFKKQDDDVDTDDEQRNSED
jgi:hypothetical protein